MRLFTSLRTLVARNIDVSIDSTYLFKKLDTFVVEVDANTSTALTRTFPCAAKDATLTNCSLPQHYFYCDLPPFADLCINSGDCLDEPIETKHTTIDETTIDAFGVPQCFDFGNYLCQYASELYRCPIAPCNGERQFCERLLGHPTCFGDAGEAEECGVHGLKLPAGQSVAEVGFTNASLCVQIVVYEHKRTGSVVRVEIRTDSGTFEDLPIEAVPLMAPLADPNATHAISIFRW